LEEQVFNAKLEVAVILEVTTMVLVVLVAAIIEELPVVPVLQDQYLSS